MTRLRGERRATAAPALWLAILTIAGCGGGPRPAVAPEPAERNPVAQLRHDLDQALSDPTLSRATWGIAVRSLDAQDTLYEAGSRKLLLPASTMKLITLAAAAEHLGWDFSFETQLLGVGAIDFGFLDGDLVVVGSGDPSIDDWDGAATALFRFWSDRLKTLGVRTIGGRLIGDDNAFEDVGLGAGWAWDDLSASFATAAGALQFNQNTARVSIAAGATPGLPVTLAVVPPYAPITIRSTVTTGAGDSPPSISARRLSGSAVVELDGSAPAGAPVQFRNVSVENPTKYFLAALQAAFVENGIEIRGDVADIDDLESPPPHRDGVPLIVHRSPRLSELAQTMMRNSQNMYAETLLRALGAAPGSAASDEQGRAVIREWLRRWGIAAEDAIVADGSGLSRYNLITADALVKVLEQVARDERLAGPFVAALPVAGRDGTLAARMRGTAAEGMVRAKTGSFSNARALAGYVTTADGERLAFAIIANNFGGATAAVDRAVDAMMTLLAAFSRR